MTQALSWKNYYRPIVDGTQVRASVTNSPLSDLFQNQLYLKNYLDNMQAGKALVVPDQALASTVVVGTPVYMSTTGVWQPAQAELNSTPNSSLFTLTDKAFVAGLVVAKAVNGRGDVAIQGQITFDSTFVSVVEGTFIGGLQYLSPYTAGKLQSSKGSVPVRVCLAYGPDSQGNYRVIINPDQRVQLESHGHYHFALEDQPAGEPNCVPCKDGFLWGDLEPDGPYPGTIHAVINPDSSLPGWLPVTDSIFTGMTIPVGAKFGYNIRCNTALNAVWPPLPIECVSIEIDGNDEVGNTIEVNTDGIWWMNDTYGHAPWPTNLPCNGKLYGSSSSSGPCPIWPVRIDLWFSKTLHGTTVEALDNQIDLMSGVNPGIAPVAVGSLIEPYMLTTGVNAYQLGYPPINTSSSSTAGTVEPDTIVYRLDARAFTVIGTTVPTVQIEVVLGGSPGVQSSIATILAGLALYVNRVPATLISTLGNFSDFTRTLIPWSEFPDKTYVPSAQYFRVRSPTIGLTASSVYYLELVWSGSVLTDISDKVYILAVRPVIAI